MVISIILLVKVKNKIFLIFPATKYHMTYFFDKDSQAAP